MRLKKLLASILVACMVVTAVPVTAMASDAYTGTIEPLTFSADAEVTLNGVTITATEGKSAISIENSADVTLVLVGENRLTGGKGGAGIYVAEGASVTIKGDGELTAIGNDGADTADSGAAGIGGTYANGNSGAITIDGAEVVAKGYGVHGSGIGSGFGQVVGEINIINGADVTAYGGYYANGDGTKLQSEYGKSAPEGGAAIGGGGKTVSTIADITITDSKVTAYGGSKAAGIGANFWSSCGTITISGNSDVTAQGGSSSAGIGTSREGDNGVTANIVISGGKVTATGGAYGAGIGRGYNNDSLGNGEDASKLPEMNITISGGVVTATGGEGGAGIGGGYKGNGLDIDITGGKVTAAAGPLVSGKTVENGGGASAIGSGANGSGKFVGEDVEISENAKVTVTNYYEGDGAKLAVEGFDNNDQFLVPVAKIGDKTYTSLQKAVDAAVDGDTITVIADYDFTEGPLAKLDGTYNTVAVVEEKTVTIDLNGKTINGTYDNEDTMMVGVFSTDNNGHLILKDSSNGEGKVDVKAGDGTVYYLLSSYTPGCTITIEGGNYILDKAGDALIHSDGDDGVFVTGGNFELGNVGTGGNGRPWIFNINGKCAGQAFVTGGTFNTDINHQYWCEVEVPVTKALKANNNNGTWTVVDSAAYTTESICHERHSREIGYATLDEVIVAADDDAIITLTKNGKIKSGVVVGTIELNGYSLEISGGSFKSADSETFYLKDSVVSGCVAEWNTTTEMWDIVTAPGSVATIGNVGYKTLAAAVAAAEDGDTIVLLENNAENVTVSREVTFTLETNNKEFTGSIVAGSGYNKEVENGTYTFTENVPDPTPSRGGGGSTKYKVSMDADEIENGTINLSPSKAKKGATVTITVTPDEGYELDELTVLDKDGNEVELTDKGNGKFTFKMPKGGVEIEASFEEIDTDAPVVIPSEGDKEETTLVLTIGQTIYQLDGNYAANDVAPIIKADRTFLPIRLVAEALGATVTWSEADQSVTIVKGDTTIVIYIGQAFALVNGNPVELDEPAFIANDRTYLPVRFVAENLGADVTWDAETQTVTIIG